jgi:hypothetical protein
MIWLLLAITVLNGCRENKEIDPDLFKGDWISQQDNRLIFAEDSMMIQDLIYTSIPCVKYKISHDTINIFTIDYEYIDYHEKRNLVWKYKIMELDSTRLSISRIAPIKKSYPDDKDTLNFSRYGTKKINDLEINYLELSTHGCYGPCPVLDIMINQDSTLFISGYRYSNLRGLNFCKLNKSEYSRIKAKLNMIPRDSIYFDPPVPDAPGYSIYIRSGKDSIVNNGCIMSINPYLSNFIFYMKSLSYLLNMKQCKNDSVLFRDKRNSRLYSFNEQ